MIKPADQYVFEIMKDQEETLSVIQKAQREAAEEAIRAVFKVTPYELSIPWKVAQLNLCSSNVPTKLHELELDVIVEKTLKKLGFGDENV